MNSVAQDHLPTNTQKQGLLGRITAFFVYLFDRIMPDPYVFAVGLTFLGAALAYLLVPHTSLSIIGVAWYNGLFAIFGFAFQMVIMLVAGYALASSPVIHRVLAGVASLPKSKPSAVSLTVLVGMVASWLNWGLGLVTAALLAREIAKRMRIDFGWLVAAAYSGFVISTEGLSGSIALSQATHGSVLNIVEKVTGRILPLSETVFTSFNLIPIAVLLVLLPIQFRFLEPAPALAQPADAERLCKEDEIGSGIERGTGLGVWLDNAWILNLGLVLLGGTALAFVWLKAGVSIDLNSVILILFLGGVLLHWRPIAYVTAIKKAGRISGALVLQYPLYGGLMGVISGTGLAAVLSRAFIRFSTAHTLPFYTFLTSLVLTLFVPSGGGHWAVQGPIAIPAALSLHASMAKTTMAVAMGESVANMLQPFWAIPILAIAGIGIRRIMGFMVMTFFISLLTFGIALLVS